MPTKAQKNRYMLIDGNALIHRGYHAVPGLTNKAGMPTGAIYGFTMILLRAIKDLKPTHIACSFDLVAPTFRHQAYAEYKGTRVKADQELYDQIPQVKEVVRSLNIPIFEIEGYEADDVLGTLSHEICVTNKQECDVMIVTGDLDTLQLVNSCVKIYTLRKGLTDTAVYDEAAVIERFNLKPSQMVDYKALRGDPSDNIKGVKGIGEKGAIEILTEYGSINNLYAAIEKDEVKGKIKPRILQLLIDQEDSARQSYMLATIIKDVPLNIEIPPYEFNKSHYAKIVELFKELEFRSLLDKLPSNYTGEASVSKKRAKKIDTTQEERIAEVVVRENPKFKQDYILIDNKPKLQHLIEVLEKADTLTIDTETTGLNPINDTLVGVSLAVTTGTAWYVPASLVLESKPLQRLISSGLKKIGHNIKFDYHILRESGVGFSGVYFDTMIASYLLNAGTRQHGLDAAAFNTLGYQMQPITDLIGKGKQSITMDQVPVDKVSWYACEDVDITLRLKEVFEKDLQTEGLSELFNTIEMPLIEVLADVERCGVKLDVALLGQLSKQAQKEIEVLEKDIHSLAGEEFNISSPAQLKVILFEKLKLSSVGNRKTKTGLSTAAGELEKMLGSHPIIEKIMQYRELTKLESTYLQALPDLVNAKTGRIHTDYNQTIAATGRLSSTNPNLQNIPARGTGLGSEIRKAFVAEKGYKLLSIDYSQIELRVVAHLAQDKNMMDIFAQGNDIHTATAMGIFGVSGEDVTKDMRRHAKTVNFGILYGLSAFGLSYRINELAHMDAKEYIEKYFESYPGVKQYIDSVKKAVNDNGYVKNELGRIRKFPEIKSPQYFIRQAAERAAINFPVQSLAADVIKVAMINIYKEIGKQQSEIRMILQVHDELVFEVKSDKVEYYRDVLKPIMESAITLSVPITVEAKVGDNWGEMEKI